MPNSTVLLNEQIFSQEEIESIGFSPDGLELVISLNTELYDDEKVSQIGDLNSQVSVVFKEGQTTVFKKTALSYENRLIYNAEQGFKRSLAFKFA